MLRIRSPNYRAMDTLLRLFQWSNLWAYGLISPIPGGFVLAVLETGITYGQSRPAILPLSIHREASMPGWIPGQWSWPATPPRPDVRWTSSVGGRFHPFVPALTEFVFSVGYAPDRDWLTLGISRQGTDTYRRHQIVVGYSKSMKHNRAGLSLQWNRTSVSQYQAQHLSAVLGSEQAIGANWRIGFGLQHPMILGRPSGHNPPTDANAEPAQGLNLGLYGVMDRSPLLIQGTMHFSLINGWRSELGVVYRRSSGLGIAFSTDPVKILFNFGICYITNRNSLWTSTLYSPLPGLCYQTAWEGGIP
jgi:hypothetical protein